MCSLFFSVAVWCSSLDFSGFGAGRAQKPFASLIIGMVFHRVSFTSSTTPRRPRPSTLERALPRAKDSFSLIEEINKDSQDVPRVSGLEHEERKANRGEANKKEKIALADSIETNASERARGDEESESYSRKKKAKRQQKCVSESS